MDILTRLPDELKDHVISFYGCKHCFYNDCHIHELHKKYFYPREKCDQNDYEFIGERTIREVDITQWVPSSNIYRCTIRRSYSIYSDTVVTFRLFATNIPVEFIEHIEFDIGGAQIETIEPKLFDVLYSIYSLPEQNENGYTVIPFYISKIGIEHLAYHNISIFIRLKENCDENFKIQFCEQYAININDRRTRYYYFSNHVGSYQRLLATRPVYYILIEDDVESITISDMNLYLTPGIDELTLTRLKKFKHVSLFKIAQSLDDFKHSIEFNEICSARINIDKNINMYAIQQMVFVTVSGTGGVI